MIGKPALLLAAAVACTPAATSVPPPATSAVATTPQPGKDDYCPELYTCAKDSDCVGGVAKCELGCCVSPYAAQQSPVTRSGHEFLTLESARKAKSAGAAFPSEGADDVEVKGKCKGRCTHGANSFRAWSAIMGVRWADIMGFRAGPLFPAQQRCLSAVAQDNEDVQYDHALRRFADEGAAGGLAAIQGIRDRLARRFEEAVLASDDEIRVADGGAQQDHFRVSKPEFLLGRALHIVQDSFSTFHTQRSGAELQQLVQINSYVCTAGAPAHPHVMPGVLDLLWTGKGDGNGDVVWRDGCDGERAECLKAEYLPAVAASRDLWAAFYRARSAGAERSVVIKQEVAAFLAKWFVAPTSVAVSPATAGCEYLDYPLLEKRREACLKMTGTGSTGERVAPFDWNRLSFKSIP